MTDLFCSLEIYCSNTKPDRGTGKSRVVTCLSASFDYFNILKWQISYKMKLLNEKQNKKKQQKQIKLTFKIFSFWRTRFSAQ